MRSPYRYTIIFNPTANRSKARRLLPSVLRALEDTNLDAEVVESPSPEELPLLAAETWKDGRTPVAMGGDGTVNIVARGLLLSGERGSHLSEKQPRPKIGIIACGSGNDTAAALGLPIKDPPAAIRTLASQATAPVDVVIVECDSGEVGVSLAVVASGFDSEVTEAAERIKLIKGPLRYTVAVFTTLVRSKPALFEITLDDGETQRFPAWLVAVANGPRYGGRMKVAPQASVTDGLADLCIVGPVTRRHFVRTFPKVFKGTHVNDPHIKIARAKRVRLSASPPFVCYGDGERIGTLPATFEIRNQALEVIGAQVEKEGRAQDAATEQ